MTNAPQITRFIGIDPGSQQMGVAFVEKKEGELACIYSNHIKAPKQDLPLRLAYLRRELMNLVLEFKPQYACVEKVFHGVNSKTAFVLGHSRGVALSVMGEYQIKVEEVAPTALKKLITGKGNATKQEVQIFLANYYQKDDFVSLDASDALALATCSAIRFNQQVRGKEI